MEGVDAHELPLFEALQESRSGLELLGTRRRSAGSAGQRLALLARTVPVNRPHLRMRLGRPLTRADMWREQGARAGALAAWAWRTAVRRGG